MNPAGVFVCRLFVGIGEAMFVSYIFFLDITFLTR